MERLFVDENLPPQTQNKPVWVIETKNKHDMPIYFQNIGMSMKAGNIDRKKLFWSIDINKCQHWETKDEALCYLWAFCEPEIGATVKEHILL